MTTQPATNLSGYVAGSLYPFAHVFKVTTNDTTAVAVWNIPDATLITGVLCKIITASTGNASNIIVGDTDDDNGFVLAASICGATANTIYGDTHSERGEYLITKATDHGHVWKYYSAAGKIMYIDCSAAMTTEGVVEILVFGYSMHEV